MTEQNLDEMLTKLYQDREPLPPEWNERLKKKQTGKKRVLWQHRKIAAAILLLCLMGVPASVYAYFHYMTPAQIAEKMELHKLAEQFGKHQDNIQSISSKGYRINYLGIVTGKNLEKGLEGAEIDREKTYIVTAIQKENGKAMTYSDRFFVSPLIEGLEPIHYNLSTMGGTAIRMIKNGIQYSITACDSIGIFADRTMYLAVQDGNALNGEAYTLHAETGEIKANANYPNINVLFPIQLDKSMADKEKAAAYIAEAEKGLNESSNTNTEKDTKEENVTFERPTDYVAKFQDITLKLLAIDDFAQLSINRYEENDNGNEEVWQTIGFFPVIQGKGIKKISFSIDGGMFYSLDTLSKQEIESLNDPYSPLYEKYKNFVHGYDKNDKKIYYGMKKGMDSIHISMKGDKAQEQYMIRVHDEVLDPSSETTRRDQKKLVKKIETMKIKMKIEKEDNSVIEKTITCKTKKFETKELDHDFYYCMYSVQ